MPVGYFHIPQSLLILSFLAVIKMEGGTDHDLRALDNENDETKDKPEVSASDEGGVSDASTGKLF
jgi:hypothetical protein